MAATQALPVSPVPRITQDIRVAVGVKKKGAKAPERLDYMILTVWDAELGSYKVDTSAMQAAFAYIRDRVPAENLSEYIKFADNKPKGILRLPISVRGHLDVVENPAIPGSDMLEVPDTILWSRLARYQGSRRVCACGKFRLKDKDLCQKSNTPYPPDPDSIGAWVGRAYARQYGERGFSEFKRVCDPATCQYRADKSCKPQTIFSFGLPFMPKLGTVAKLVTTSWQSYQKIRGSLIEIGRLNQGWLAMLPLELVVTKETVSAEGFKSPILHVEFVGDEAALAEATVEVKGRLMGLDHQIRALGAPANLKALDEGEDARAYSREFSHETEDALSAGGLEEVLHDLASRAGWSDTRLQQELATYGDTGHAAMQDVIARLEAEVYGESAPVDAEFEDEQPEVAQDDEQPPYDPALFAGYEEEVQQ